MKGGVPQEVLTEYEKVIAKAFMSPIVFAKRHVYLMNQEGKDLVFKVLDMRPILESGATYAVTKVIPRTMTVNTNFRVEIQSGSLWWNTAATTNR